MKLVFYDGWLSSNLANYETKNLSEFIKNWSEENGFEFILWKYDWPSAIITAGAGITNVLSDFKFYSRSEEDNSGKEKVLLTNSTDLLDYFNYKDIYLLRFDRVNLNKTICPLQECCDKELRDYHDIRKLYLNGEFGFPTTH